MARRYSNNFPVVTNTASTTVQQTIGASTIRFQVYDLLLSGAGVAPADNAADYQIKRCTAGGTVTSFIPIALDSGDPATLCVQATSGCGYSATGEPTYTAGAILMGVGVNMRATFRWVARERSELVAPATTSNGMGLFTRAVNSAFSISGTLMYEE